MTQPSPAPSASERQPWEAVAQQLLDIHRRLTDHYGPLHWWPADTPFEVVVGTVLTQNTAWGNVEKALANLKAAGALEPAALLALPLDTLADLIRPSGTYTVKARRLQGLLQWLGEDWQARLTGDLEKLRHELLSVPGVGPETADAILLYARGYPTFVVDAYTRRILGRLSIRPADESYEGYRRLFMNHLPPNAALYNEYHAQLVQLGKDFCRTTPRCIGCPLQDVCATGGKQPI